MTAALDNHLPAIAKQHLTNMATSLDHRIDVARTNNDYRLLELLLKEKDQLESLPGHWLDAPKNIGERLRFLWKKIVQTFENADKLNVEKIVDISGNVWWYAHDPRTGKALWAESEPEIVKWIEDNDLGN